MTRFPLKTVHNCKAFDAITSCRSEIVQNMIFDISLRANFEPGRHR